MDNIYNPTSVHTVEWGGAVGRGEKRRGGRGTVQGDGGPSSGTPDAAGYPFARPLQPSFITTTGGGGGGRRGKAWEVQG